MKICNLKADGPEVMAYAGMIAKNGPARKIIVGQTIIYVRYHIYTNKQEQVEAVAVMKFPTWKGFTVTVRICRILHWVI